MNDPQLKQKKIARIEVDRDLCIGAQSCVVVAPSVFQLDAENKAVIFKSKGDSDSGPTKREELAAIAMDDDTLMLAAQSCPTLAIKLFDEEGNQLYP
ncbi:MAG: hypothetical protein HW383_316 [Candidatus Magasanikbacteria bacterium]|nr:hypothetical protein [Candidatus Magasanikbacteria bacterium]